MSCCDGVACCAISHTGSQDDDGSGASSSGGGKGKGGGLKPANKINVRHILCEKHAKITEALGKLREGTPFDKVAEAYSEDKARQGGARAP